MATENEPQSPVKNPWTRWYMWFLYSSVGLLIFVVVIIAVAPDPEPDNSTPEERMARLEATQAAESINATRQASEQQTKDASTRFEEQTKTAADLHMQQTKEIENAPEPDREYCREIALYFATLVGPLHEITQIVDSVQESNDTYENPGLATELEAKKAALVAEGIEDIDAPKDARQLHSLIEDYSEKVIEFENALFAGDTALAVNNMQELADDTDIISREMKIYCGL